MAFGVPSSDCSAKSGFVAYVFSCVPSAIGVSPLAFIVASAVSNSAYVDSATATPA